MPVERFFTYQIPQEFTQKIVLGSRVFVSFKSKKKLLGIVVAIHSNKPDFSVKLIESISPNTPLPFYYLEISKSISSYYMCTINQAIHLFSHSDELKRNLKIQKEKQLESKIYLKEASLKESQEKVFLSIIKDSKNLKHFFIGLLFGITGSGKTEIYISLIQYILKNYDKQVLILLPEIALTTQIIERFTNYFGNENLGVIHSRQSIKEKRDVLNKIASHEVKIILGPRSALFSPFNKLGLIIIDEEHDFSYKSNTTPRYHAKHVAYILAKHLNIPYLLGSATPSLEVYYSCQQKKIFLYELKKRYHQTPLPTIELVSMEKELGVFSKTLIQHIFITAQNKEQSLLFINRRGFSPLAICESCHHLKQCPSCSISLTYHKKENILQCHYCDYKEPFYIKCPSCSQMTIKSQGAGTEKITEEIAELFHTLKVLRMDKDTTRLKNQHDDILKEFKDGKADILVGTQMITKGLDFPLVNLVGVLSCDTILNLPDFRSSEYAFSLLTQVAGRSGRKTKGKVIIQTNYTEHYAVKYAQDHDFLSFFKKEVAKRHQYDYPPFCKIIRIIVRSKLEETSQIMIDKITIMLKNEFPHTDIIGPSICILQKIADYYRYHLFMRVKNPLSYTAGIKKILKIYRNSKNFYIEVDVDPTTML